MAGVFILVALAAFALADTLVVPVTMSGYAVAPGTCMHCPAIVRTEVNLPDRMPMTLSWSEVAGDPVIFGFSPILGPGCFWWNATQGSCSFISNGGNYTAYLAPPYPPTQFTYVVSFTFAYYEPLL